jgi:hypothetical protein
MTPDHVESLLKKLWEMGMAGDVAAIRLYLSYTVGKPFDATDLENLDLNGLRLADELVDRITEDESRSVEVAAQDRICPTS